MKKLYSTYGSQQRMDIGHPLLRALRQAEQAHTAAVPRPRVRRFLTLRSLIPRIPRPLRQVFYRIPGLKVLPYIFIPLRSFHLAKNTTRSLKQRFFSLEARQKRQQKRKFIKWWTLTLLTVVLGLVAAKICYERGETFDDDELYDKYRIKPKSWHLYMYLTLPLKAISRIWGQVNSINLPVWVRLPLYRLYLMIFGVNLDEMNEPDLTTYPNLGEFFYRELKPGVRPVAEDDLVSPSDGKVLSFGVINDGEIEQVKGMTYSVDALLGLKRTRLAAPSHALDFGDGDDDETIYSRHQEFADSNGISYTMDDLVGGDDESQHLNELAYMDNGDGTAEVPLKQKEMAVARKLVPADLKALEDKQVYYCVIYLAPGDYHRYHSPTNWVATLRRHFIGELFSVAPFFQKTLQGLFVLNERVALLGYWKYGFFSMVPVGATNVGSIVVNFDKDLKTNTKYESDHYQKIADETSPLLSLDTDLEATLVSSLSQASAKKKKLKKNAVYEATYTNASKLLGGVPLSKGQEVGGFKLGSTVVLVFEAPANYRFNLHEGQKVKMGQSLGSFVQRS